jgi:hypothetical protein
VLHAEKNILGLASEFNESETTIVPKVILILRWSLFEQVFYIVCRWGPFANGPVPFADALLGVLPMLQLEVLLPSEPSIHLEPSLLHLRIPS